MKTKIVSIALAAMTVFCFTACQATPKQDVVVGKDTERMVEKAQDADNGTKLPDLNLPVENYTYSAVGSDERLTINIDAKVTAPENGTISMAKTSMKGGFSQETVTKAFNYLFPDEKPTIQQAGETITKDELEEQILNLKKQIADKSYDTQEFTEEDMKNQLKKLEEQYKTAPETAGEKVVSDGTMQPYSKETHLGVTNGYILDVEDSNGHSLQVRAFGENANSMNYDRLTYYVMGAYDYNMSGAVQISDDGDIPDAVKAKLTMSYDAAKEQAASFLAAVGIGNDYVLSECYIVSDVGLASVDGGVNEGKVGNYGYKLFFSRMYKGAMIATNVCALSSISESENVADLWRSEVLSITIDNDGIVQIDWGSPLEITEEVTEDTGLITFDAAIDIFQKMVDTKFVPDIKMNDNNDSYGIAKVLSAEINVNEIRLGLVNTRYQNAAHEGVLTPCYLFYGHKVEKSVMDGKEYVYYDIGSDFSGQSAIIMAINAVDGSVINMAAGY